MVLLTRGLVADMGPALSHADKIVRLFMDGYTETEIVRRTGHTYDSIERYLLDFARLVYLAEQVLPLPAIRKVLGFSRRLVEKYLNLYREFSGPDYFFTTYLDLEWILGLSPTLIRELLEAYQECFGVLLPTAGTVLDMGRTLTHKTIVVELALQGLTTQEIARRIYHTPEAVDNYLRIFDRVLLLRYYKLPLSAMVRVTGHSQRLLEEHLALVEKHFSDEAALEVYLGKRGITLEKSD